MDDDDDDDDDDDNVMPFSTPHPVYHPFVPSFKRASLLPFRRQKVILLTI